MNNYTKKTVLETFDEFATRRVQENQDNYNAGYVDGYDEGFESALAEIFEMIEEDASYNEVYESIGEYLKEVFDRDNADRLKQMRMKPNQQQIRAATPKLSKSLPRLEPLKRPNIKSSINYSNLASR